MNYSTAVFVLNDHCRLIAATYEPDSTSPAALMAKAAPGEVRLARTLFKTFDQTIKKDDLIIVPTNTRHKFTICKVVEVGLQVDLDSSLHIDWVAGVFDQTEHNRTLAMEAEMARTMRDADLQTKREALRASLMANSGGSKLLALPISSIKDVE
jgi:hypothetical protein